MKKSYKILGLPWDGIDDSDTKPVVVGAETISTVLDYRVGMHLFDSIEYARTVSLKELLTVEEQALLDNIIVRLRPCRTIYIILDFQPNCNSVIVRRFYTKLLRKIYQLFKGSLTGAKIIFACV